MLMLNHLNGFGVGERFYPSSLSPAISGTNAVSSVGLSNPGFNNEVIGEEATSSIGSIYLGVSRAFTGVSGATSVGSVDSGTWVSIFGPTYMSMSDLTWDGTKYVAGPSNIYPKLGLLANACPTSATKMRVSISADLTGSANSPYGPVWTEAALPNNNYAYGGAIFSLTAPTSFVATLNMAPPNKTVVEPNIIVMDLANFVTFTYVHITNFEVYLP